VDILAIGYDQFEELLNQSDATREMFHRYADLHEAENVKGRGVPA
jgi:hypothetical protein